MDSSDSDLPIPKKRTITGQKKRPLEPSAMSSPHQSRRSRRCDITEEESPVETVDKKQRKPRLPKPKSRSVQAHSSTISNNSNTADDIPDYRSESTSFISDATKRLGSRHAGEAGKHIKDEKADVSSGVGNMGNTPTGIREILQAFQEDVVKVKSSQRNKWQQKLDEIHESQLFPEFGRKFQTVRGGGGDDGSVPSKWKSAASLVPRDIQDPSPMNNDLINTDEYFVMRVCQNLNRLSAYCSGILAGILLWKALFAISQLISGKMINFDPYLWTLYWSLSSPLLLVTLLGLIKTSMDDFSWRSGVRLFSSIVIFAAFYLSKAFDLQRQECRTYLEITPADTKHVHLTYDCDASTAGKSWSALNYWNVSMDVIPAIGAIVIYTHLHITRNQENSGPRSGQKHSASPADALDIP